MASASTSATSSSARCAPTSRARPWRSTPNARSPRSSRRSTRAGPRSFACAIPTVLPKAIKNEAEIAGQKAAQARDGAAIARFLKWIDDEAPKGELDEIIAADRLEALPPRAWRSARPVSFDTISAPAPMARSSITRATEETNRKLETGTLYLVDSGGQYVDGTTDITRTVPIGEPTRGNARPLHPRAPGPYRDRHRDLPQGNARQPARQFRPAAACGRRARLCPWHRPRRRQLPLGPRRAAAHFAGRSRASRAATSRSWPA